jgi:hypothetical protein
MTIIIGIDNNNEVVTLEYLESLIEEKEYYKIDNITLYIEKNVDLYSKYPFFYDLSLCKIILYCINNEEYSILDRILFYCGYNEYKEIIYMIVRENKKEMYNIYIDKFFDSEYRPKIINFIAYDKIIKNFCKQNIHGDHFF